MKKTICCCYMYYYQLKYCLWVTQKMCIYMWECFLYLLLGHRLYQYLLQLVAEHFQLEEGIVVECICFYFFLYEKLSTHAWILYTQQEQKETRQNLTSATTWVVWHSYLCISLSISGYAFTWHNAYFYIHLQSGPAHSATAVVDFSTKENCYYNSLKPKLTSCLDRLKKDTVHKLTGRCAKQGIDYGGIHSSHYKLLVLQKPQHNHAYTIDLKRLIMETLPKKLLT